ncbi:hypothetical protein VTP01DRAFT_7228 [Rhizomucor pusillus]|uniref:uncharacterized protein n=1 Tax=Rhizomucor pusillus TaxID=4840 RepID=UPI0037433B78
MILDRLLHAHSLKIAGSGMVFTLDRYGTNACTYYLRGLRVGCRLSIIAGIGLDANAFALSGLEILLFRMAMTAGDIVEVITIFHPFVQPRQADSFKDTHTGKKG